MTGSPLYQFLPALLGVCLTGGLLYHITAPPGATQISEAPPSADNAPEMPAMLCIKCAHRPVSITIRHGQQIIRQSQMPTCYEEVHCSLPAHAAELTLNVSARWPEGTPDTPVTLTLEPEGKHAATATVWSFGPELNDTCTFSWK